MVHNPHWNKHPVGGRPWTAEEDAQTAALLREGAPFPEIADKIKRTIAAVKSRVRYLGLTDEEKERRLEIQRRAAQPVVRMRIEHVYERAPTIPPEVIEERNQRYLAARSLTAILMGDPEDCRRRA